MHHPHPEQAHALADLTPAKNRLADLAESLKLPQAATGRRLDESVDHSLPDTGGTPSLTALVDRV
jgi:hypothetical protein